ncbi:MAG TPA: Fic family protein [Tepidisphaeraceae bacterium]
MKRQDFTSSAWGQIVRTIGGIDASVPNTLPPNIAYSPELIGQLSTADRALGQLGGIARTLPNPRLLIRSFVNREAVLSSRIEGTHASLEDLFLFEVNPAVEETVPDVVEVHNYVRALDHGLVQLRRISLTLNLIRELHGILLDGVRGSDRHPGEFRRIQNWIGPVRCTLENATYVPPPPEKLAACLDAFERFVNTPNSIPLLVRLAMVHYQFEAIHPFEDGNGRVGRLLISLLLDSERAIAHPVLYLSAYFEKHRNQYYELLRDVSQKGTWIEWITFFLRGVSEQSIDAVERAAKLTALRNSWALRCQKARTSALLVKLVDGLFNNPFITLSRAAELLEVRPQSAQNNINQLIKMDILEEITGQRRNRVYVAREVIRTLEETPALDLTSHGERNGSTKN